MYAYLYNITYRNIWKLPKIELKENGNECHRLTQTLNGKMQIASHLISLSLSQSRDPIFPAKTKRMIVVYGISLFPRITYTTQHYYLV